MTPTNTPPKKRRNNRTAGHSFEIKIRNQFRDIGFPHVVTSRSESRSRDNQKIDLINQDEGTNGRFPYNVQCKNVSSHLKYKKILGEIKSHPECINVVIHKLTTNIRKKGEKGNFVHEGTYAILSVEDFMKMASMLKVLMEDKPDIPTLKRQVNGNY